jgi:hypothetical protein
MFGTVAGVDWTGACGIGRLTGGARTVWSCASRFELRGEFASAIFT